MHVSFPSFSAFDGSNGGAGEKYKTSLSQGLWIPLGMYCRYCTLLEKSMEEKIYSAVLCCAVKSIHYSMVKKKYFWGVLQ